MDNGEQPNLINLPGVLVSRVASYLPKPVRSLLPRTSNVCFAMGLAHSRVSSRQWKKLDIGDIQQICDSNLTDDDIRRILIAIDGVNKIKSLKLTHCFGITGTGLSPLRGSRVLERIDLSGNSLTDDDIRRILIAIDGVNKIKSLKLTHCFGITGTGLSPLRGSRVLERIDLSGNSLTDDDIRQMLLAIDGVNKIKSLRLTHCFGITGAGLSPLRGSTVLQRIDLSGLAVGRRRSMLSEEEVVPIFSSILDREDNSLSYVVLPFHCRKDRSVVLSSFLRRFNDALLSRRNDQHGRDDDWLCESCEGRFFEGCIEVGKCGQCEKETCEDCGDYCEKCESIFCSSCGLLGVCDHCEKECCSHCSVKCNECNKVNCEECASEDEEGIKECSMYDWGCGSTCCFDCRVSRMDNCIGCAAMVAPSLARKVDRLQRKNQMLQRWMGR